MAKAMNLVKAYMTEQIPSSGGFIVSTYFDADSAYTIYEITAYKNVKDIYQSPEGLTFKTDGNRTHILVEPTSYPQRYSEPVNRETGKSVPYRFDDMTILTGKKLEKIMIPINPIMLYTSFTVLKDQGDNFSFIFHPTEDVYTALKTFIADSLYNDCGLAKDDAKEASETVIATIKKFSVWQN